MERILRYVALWLARILESYGDPLLQAKLDSFNAKVAEAGQKERKAEAAARASEAAYLTSLNHRQELDKLIQTSIEQENASEQRLAESQQRVKQLEIENQKAKADLDARSDADVLRDKL